MAYILNKTNGSILATVQDSAIDTTTDLTFLGKNYAGYGELQNENFLKLLENFSNSTAPEKPIEGQLWYDNTNNVLNVYDGEYWKSLGKIDISDIDPSSTKTYITGDLWYNSDSQQLYVYNGTEFILVGPQSGADIIASWKGSYEYSTSTVEKQYNIKAIVGFEDSVVAVVSDRAYLTEKINDQYTVSRSRDQFSESNFLVQRGITLYGAHPTTGSSKETGFYFWGTAAEALRADRATTADIASGISFSSTNTNQLYYVPFVSTGTTNTSTHIDTSTTGLYYNPSTNILYGTASAALYSDLAERYHADSQYGEGTVLVIGGDFEVTISSVEADVSVAGIVSVKPAFRMNEGAGDQFTHPFIALKGRVPCKVVGRIRKGDLIVTSKTPGHGRAFENGDSPNAVFAKALESHHSDNEGRIEVMVV
jgi:hypothetical protein